MECIEVLGAPGAAIGSKARWHPRGGLTEAYIVAEGGHRWKVDACLADGDVGKYGIRVTSRLPTAPNKRPIVLALCRSMISA